MNRSSRRSQEDKEQGKKEETNQKRRETEKVKQFPT
jgi:hypothetical protein